MDTYLKIWEPVLRSFVEQFEAEFYNQNAEKGHFCEEDEKPDYEIVDWYPSGHLEITVKMRDGRQFIYEFMGSNIYPLRSNWKVNAAKESTWAARFSRQLRAKMKKSGVSQERLSELTGISRVMLSKYMNGTACPSGYNLDRICDALQCSLNELGRNL